MEKKEKLKNNEIEDEERLGFVVVCFCALCCFVEDFEILRPQRLVLFFPAFIYLFIYFVDLLFRNFCREREFENPRMRNNPKAIIQSLCFFNIYLNTLNFPFFLRFSISFSEHFFSLNIFFPFAVLLAISVSTTASLVLQIRSCIVVLSRFF